MKRILYFVLAAAMLAMFGCTGDTNISSVGTPNPNTLVPTGSIQGRLIDACTQMPIANAIIDIGVAKAVTSSDGQYTLLNVPATTQADGSLCGSYSVTIDMRNALTSSGTAFPAGTYPSFSYQEATVKFSTLNDAYPSSNHATPVTGIMTGDQDFVIGQLNAQIVGTATFDSSVKASGSVQPLLPVPDGYYVQLIASKYGNSDTTVNDSGGTSSSNSTTGLLGNLVATTTTKGGSFSFSGVESNRTFYVVVTDTNPTSLTSTAPAYKGCYTICTLCSGAVVYPSVTVSTTTSPTEPCLTAVAPANGSSVSVSADGSSSVSVTFTFNQAITPSGTNGLSTATASDALTSAGNPNNIYANVNVNFEGYKSSNVAHSLSWNATGTVLTVTIPNVAPAGIYSVDISPALAEGTQNIGATADCGVSGAVTFYTYGSSTAGAPTVSLLNTPYDYNDTVLLSWVPTSQAKAYDVYCETVQNWGTSSEAGQWVLMPGSPTLNTFYSFNASTVNLSSILGIQSLTDTFVENNSIQITYNCKVRGVNADGTEGPDATGNEVDNIKDTVPPTVVSSTLLSQLQNGVPFTSFTITFDEPLNKATAQTAANYAFDASGFAPTATPPTVTSAILDVTGRIVTVTFAPAINPSNGTVVEDSITTGANGIAESFAVFDDVTVVQPGNGLANTPCITQTATGAVGAFTLGGDDVAATGLPVSVPAGTTLVNSGPNGICESTAGAGSTQTLALGAVQAGPSTEITAGANYLLDTIPGGDDKTVTKINIVTVTGVTDVAGNAIVKLNNLTTDGIVQ